MFKDTLANAATTVYLLWTAVYLLWMAEKQWASVDAEFDKFANSETNTGI